MAFACIILSQVKQDFLLLQIQGSGQERRSCLDLAARHFGRRVRLLGTLSGSVEHCPSCSVLFPSQAPVGWPFRRLPAPLGTCGHGRMPGTCCSAAVLRHLSLAEGPAPPCICAGDVNKAIRTSQRSFEAANGPGCWFIHTCCTGFLAGRSARKGHCKCMARALSTPCVCRFIVALPQCSIASSFQVLDPEFPTNSNETVGRFSCMSEWLHAFVCEQKYLRHTYRCGNALETLVHASWAPGLLRLMERYNLDLQQTAKATRPSYGNDRSSIF